jgi:hypothetical protein
MMNFMFQPVDTFIFFVLLFKVVFPLNVYNHTKFYGATLTGARFCTHPRNVNVRRFGLFLAAKLKISASGSPSVA